MEDKITADLKEAMFAKDAQRTSVLRSIKSAITYVKVAPGASGESMSDDDIIVLLAKEAKKRQESADSYLKAGQPERADDELAEKNIIEEYLPGQLSEDDLRGVVEEEITKLAAVTPQAIGQVIGAVKAKAGPAADGGLIARLVRERLGQDSELRQ
jgi:uncharacterized protein YqeY